MIRGVSVARARALPAVPAPGPAARARSVTAGGCATTGMVRGAHAAAFRKRPGSAPPAPGRYLRNLSRLTTSAAWGGASSS